MWKRQSTCSASSFTAVLRLEPRPARHQAEPHGHQPREKAEEHVRDGGEPDAILEERMRLELEGRERRETSAEPDAEGEPYGVGMRQGTAGQETPDHSQDERSEDVDHERAQRKPRVDQGARPPADDVARVSSDERARADEEVREEALDHRGLTTSTEQFAWETIRWEVVPNSHSLTTECPR